MSNMTKAITIHFRFGKQQSKYITLLLNPCCLSADATILHDRIRTNQNLQILGTIA